MPYSLRAIAALEVSLAVASVIATLGCGVVSLGSSSRAAQPPAVLFEERFEQPEAVQRDWLAAIPEISGAMTLIEDGAARLVLPSNGEIELEHLIDVSAVRGKRLHISARVRTDSTTADAQVAVGFGSSASNFRTRAHTKQIRAAIWTSVTTMVDVDANTLRAELSLVLRGKGNAWFDDIKIEVLGQATASPAIALSSQELENVIALTRVIALIRYRHPSDQAANLDWDAFFPWAVERVLRAEGEYTLLRELQQLFARIAPTVEFSKLQTYSHREPPHSGAVHLSRWRHAGLGPSAQYVSWREGRDADQARIRAESPIFLPHLSGCKKSQIRATVRGSGNNGQVLVYADVDLPGYSSKRFDQKVNHHDSTISVDFDMPADAYRIRLGIEVKGRSESTLEAISLFCDNGGSVQINVAEAKWQYREFTDLYSYGLEECGARRCLKIARRPLDTTFVESRDVLDAQITKQLWVHVPLAVWANDDRTLPVDNTSIPLATGTATDAAERLATIASAWATLSTFYPYFRDQNIDWLRELPVALTNAASARSTTDTHNALAELISELHDNHARAIHPSSPIDGLLPVALRKFDNKLVVVGALAEYAKFLPVGAEILSIDRVPALQAYAKMCDRVSSATAGWLAWAVPTWLTLGQVGTFSTLRLNTADVKERDVVLPHLSRELYDSAVREPRPVFGTELAPGVRYIDLEAMKADRWRAVIPSLLTTRVLIMDMRGYPSNYVFTILGHFIDNEIRSPEWQIPILESGGYLTAHWTIQPIKPRLDAKLVVLLDGRSASAAETFLQIIHDNHLAVLVGETSSGTNGNPKIVSLPGGFSMRFTGMRVPLADGTALQGRGIVPDEVVHPTLEGVRAGRDEILEAAMGLASRLVAN